MLFTPQYSTVFLDYVFLFYVATNILSIRLSQKLFGQCVNNAPVAFLKNFKVECVTRLHTCPTEPPLQTLPGDFRIQVNNGEGGMFYLLNMFWYILVRLWICVFLKCCLFCPQGDVVVEVTDEVASDPSISSTNGAATLGMCITTYHYYNQQL